MKDQKKTKERSLLEKEKNKLKKIEENFRESKLKYRKIFELSPEAIVILDKKGNILDVNGRVYDWLGYRIKEVIGKNILEVPFLSRESKVKVREKFYQRMLGKKVPSYELDFITRNEEKRIGRINATPIRDEKGKIIQDLVVISNITEQKQAEEALRQSEEKFRDLFENANDLIQSVDKKGKFVYVNRKWLEVLEYTKDELEKLTLWDILRKDQIPHCMELFKKIRNGEAVNEVDTVFISKNMKEIYVDGNANAQFKDGKFIATRGIFRDITEHKKAKEKQQIISALFKFINSTDSFDGLLKNLTSYF